MSSCAVFGTQTSSFAFDVVESMVTCMSVTVIAPSVTLAVSFTQQIQGQAVSLEGITRIKFQSLSP